MELFLRFWPDCPYPMYWRTDGEPTDYCGRVQRCADASDEPILLLQEDFFLKSLVRSDLIECALELLDWHSAGMVRLYPSPGGTEDFGHNYFARVPKGSPYRISCHASIWRPDYLARIAAGARSTGGQAGDFENLGTPYSDTQDDEVLAFKRSEPIDFENLPMNYIGSAVRRGQWLPEAIALCEKHGIEIDRSMRTIACV